MRARILALALAIACGLPAIAQGTGTDFCSPDLTETQLLACARSAPPNTAKSALAYANLGTIAYTRGDLQSAASYFRQSMPGRSVVDIHLHINRADVLYMLGEYELGFSDALIALRMAREGKDRNGTISTEDKWLVLPRLVQFLDISDSKEARDEAAAMLLALPASSADDFSDRAVVLAVTGRLKESLAAIDSAIALAPNVAMLKNNKCATLMRMGRDAEALQMCQAAYTAKSDDVTIMKSLVDAYAKNARCADARKLAYRAANLFPDDAYLKNYECPRSAH